MKWYGSPDLQSLLVPIGEVTPYPGNPRQGDVGAIAKSLERFGQTKPIAVQLSSGHIVAGNHAYHAAIALGWTHIAIAKSALTDKDAKAYLVADNRTEELGSYDFQTLGSLLAEMAREDNLEGTGYDGDDVDALLRSLEGETTSDGHGRGRTKGGACLVCGSTVAERFQLKLQWSEGNLDFSRGAGSVMLCEEDWLAHAQPNMTRPRGSFAELKSAQEEDDGEE
jgi:hypothetical protein